MIRLQERDYQVLRLCYEQKFLTREHLATFFGHYTAYYRRLRGLEEAGLLTREPGGPARSSFIVRLTRLGETTVQQEYGIWFPPLKALNLNTMYHDALVTSVRLRLSELWPETRFVPERAIQAKEFPEIPDGIFFFPSGKGIAIEVECSDKGKRRFLEKVKKLEEMPSVESVLYITLETGLLQTIRRHLDSSEKNKLIQVMLWKELEAGSSSGLLQISKVIPLFNAGL